jgi:hypothetical protein
MDLHLYKFAWDLEALWRLVSTGYLIGYVASGVSLVWGFCD